MADEDLAEIVRRLGDHDDGALDRMLGIVHEADLDGVPSLVDNAAVGEEKSRLDRWVDFRCDRVADLGLGPAACWGRGRLRARPDRLRWTRAGRNAGATISASSTTVESAASPSTATASPVSVSSSGRVWKSDRS